MLNFFRILLVIAVLLEGIFTTFPMTLSLLLAFAVLKRNESVFFLAFFAGLVLDLLGHRTLGLTSAFFSVFLFVVLLYERKYEIATVPFIVVSSFVGALVYLNLFSYEFIILQALLCSLFSAVLLSGIIVRRENLRDKLRIH